MRQYPSPLAHQSGVALIAVLLFLILIMIVGAIAVRQANVDLNVAASDQVGTLLMNNSDSVLAHIEVAAGPNASSQLNQDIMSQAKGPLGFFRVGDKSKIGHQVSLCYRPTEQDVFNVARAFIRPLQNNTLSIDASCDPTKKSSYTSERSTSMTQIIVRGLKDEASDDFINAARGTSEGGITQKISPRIQVNGVSVLPAMSDKSADVIKNCLARPVGNARGDYKITDPLGNVNDCLRQQSIPSTVVVEEGILRDEEASAYTDSGAAGTIPCQGDANCSAALQTPPPPKP